MRSGGVFRGSCNHAEDLAVSATTMRLVMVVICSCRNGEDFALVFRICGEGEYLAVSSSVRVSCSSCDHGKDFAISSLIIRIAIVVCSSSGDSEVFAIAATSIRALLGFGNSGVFAISIAIAIEIAGGMVSGCDAVVNVCTRREQ